MVKSKVILEGTINELIQHFNENIIPLSKINDCDYSFKENLTAENQLKKIANSDSTIGIVFTTKVVESNEEANKNINLEMIENFVHITKEDCKNTK